MIGLKKIAEAFRRTIPAAALIAAFLCPNASAAQINVAVADGNVEQRFVDEVNRQLSLIPEDMLYEFAMSGWSVRVTDKNIDQYYCGGAYGSVMGCTVFEENLIVIEDRDVAVTESPIHEMGHWYDEYHGHPSQTAEFGAVYASETDDFYRAFNYYSHYNQSEMFAESVWKYYCDRDNMRENCPMLYEYMDSVLSASYPDPIREETIIIEEKTDGSIEDRCAALARAALIESY